MSNSIVINRIYLENFKSVEKAVVDFSAMDLVVLDGPNGFGKTTIFDALELILTGNIRRISSNKIVSGNRGFNDHLLSKDQSKPTLVKIEFIDKNKPDQKYVLGRTLTATDLSTVQKRPGEFGNYKLLMLDEFEQDLKQGRAISEELKKILEINDIPNKYSLYHYIEQEESGHLFKQNERERILAISKLFNIEKEMNQKSFAEKIKGKLVRKRNQLEKEIVSNELNFNTTSLRMVEREKIPYEQIFRFKSVHWDQSNINQLTESLKNQYISEIDDMSIFIESFEEFKIEIKNREIQNVMNNEEKLKAIILFSFFEKDFRNIEINFRAQKNLETILNALKNKDILQKDINWKLILNDDESTLNEITNRIRLIRSYSQNSDNLSKVINNMLSTRKILMQHYDDYVKEKHGVHNRCPLCGTEKGTLAELSQDIEIKTEELKVDLDMSTKQIINETNKLYSELIDEIILRVEKQLHNPGNIDDRFYNQIKAYKNTITDIRKAIDWFTDIDINIDSYINKERIYLDNIDEKVKQLIVELNRKILVVSDQTRDKMLKFNNFYAEYYQKQDEKLKDVTLDKLNQKKRYIEYLFYLQFNDSHKKLEVTKTKLKKLDNIIGSLTRIIEVYNNSINSYRGKLISDVEIPFYIYSGKIIQNHQRGIGVFIKEDRDTLQETGEIQLRSINFVPPEKTDHDIVHTFSSGQLSSTVIAFTLALNKVYNKSGLLTLLIDDPVQTMDEMNMASFTDLLRNDFSDRQIILSTHEEKVSLFIRYKYYKYGYKAANINVKNRLYSSIEK